MLEWFAPPALAQALNLGLPFSDKAQYSSFSEYFTALVNFSIVVAGLVAVLIIVYAGFTYVQSQGEAAKVSHAKELIAGALTGLALLLMTRLILPTLNIGRTSLFGTSALAQSPDPGDIVSLDGTKLPSFSWDELFNRVIYWTTAFVALAAFCGIVYSGYMILTAGGDPGKAAKGRSNLLWSVLGLIVAMLAFVIVRFAFGVGKSLI